MHAGKHFYDGLVEFITSGPVAAIALEGPDAIAVVRRMVGKTMPNEAEPGTIRGDLGVSGLRNLIHASDAPETAEPTSSGCGSGPSALVDYRREIDAWIVAEEPAPGPGGPASEAVSQGGVLRPLDEPDPLEREVAQPGPTQDQLLVDRPEDARVLARRPVVAHHEVLVLAHDPLLRAVRRGGRASARWSRPPSGTT